MKIKFVRAETLAPGIMSFWFDPEKPVDFVPGQFADFQLPHVDMDDRGDSRQFSFTSLSSDPLLSIVVRFPDKPSSYKRALLALQPGTELHLGEPLGDFVLPKLPIIPMIWVAGGVGSAAFVSMAKELARTQEKRPVTLLQSARRSGELLFTNEWNAIGLRPIQTVTSDDSSWQGRRGRFSVDEVLAVAPTLQNTLFYVSGSDQMVDEICNALMASGVQREQLVREAFTGY